MSCAQAVHAGRALGVAAGVGPRDAFLAPRSARPHRVVLHCDRASDARKCLIVLRLLVSITSSRGAANIKLAGELGARELARRAHMHVSCQREH